MKPKPNATNKANTGNQSTANAIGIYTKSKQLKLIANIIFFGLLAAVIYHFFYQDGMLKKPYPANTFLFLQSDRFNDFFNMREWCKNMNPYFDPTYLGNSNYLPIANIFFWIFSLIPKQASLYLFTGIYSLLIYWFSYLNIPKTETPTNRHKYAFIISFLSYGYLFCFDRANLEPFVVIPIMAFFYFYVKQQHQIAILFLALAAATKIYPAIFVLLYVSDKKYKEVALTAIYTVILIIVPLCFQKGGFNQNLYFILNGFELDLNTSSFVGAFDDKGNQMLQGTSLFSVVKLLNIKMSLAITNMLGKYFIFVALIALVVIVYVVLVEKVLWRKATLLTVLIIILPHISFDYKLIHLLFCVYLFINEPKTSEDSLLNYKTISIIFGLLLIPKSYFYFSKIVTTTTGQSDVPMGTLFNPLLMLYLSFLIIKAGMKHFKKSTIKPEITGHLLAMKKSIVYIIPVVLIVIPYYSCSKKAKADYAIYKEHYLKAQENLASNKKQEAVNELNLAFANKPYKFQLPLQIANIYNELGKWDSSTVYFNKTLTIFPTCNDALFGLQSITVNSSNAKGMEALNNKKFEEAAASFKITLDAFSKLPPNPANNGFIASVYTNLSVCYINTQKWSDAKNALAQIAAIDPNNQFYKANNELVNNMINQSAAQPVK